MLSDFTRALDQLSLNIPNSKNDKKISFTTETESIIEEISRKQSNSQYRPGLEALNAIN